MHGQVHSAFNGQRSTPGPSLQTGVGNGLMQVVPAHVPVVYDVSKELSVRASSNCMLACLPLSSLCLVACLILCLCLAARHLQSLSGLECS